MAKAQAVAHRLCNVANTESGPLLSAVQFSRRRQMHLRGGNLTVVPSDAGHQGAPDKRTAAWLMRDWKTTDWLTAQVSQITGIEVACTALYMYGEVDSRRV